MLATVTRCSPQRASVPEQGATPHQPQGGLPCDRDTTVPDPQQDNQPHAEGLRQLASPPAAGFDGQCEAAPGHDTPSLLSRAVQLPPAEIHLGVGARGHLCEMATRHGRAAAPKQGRAAHFFGGQPAGHILDESCGAAAGRGKAIVPEQGLASPPSSARRPQATEVTPLPPAGQVLVEPRETAASLR